MRADHAVPPSGQGTDGRPSRAVHRLKQPGLKQPGLKQPGLKQPGLKQPGLKQPAAPLKRSFPPIADARAEVLVLGTLPGEESLRRVEYYAHPRNLFWPIIFALFGGGTPSAVYAQRLAFLQAQGIALWDVCAAAQRVASSDSTILAEMPNPIHDLLDAHPGIRAVAFNGSGARRLYDRHFRRRPELLYLALPSTSPAHARLGFAEKLARWTALREAVRGS